MSENEVQCIKQHVKPKEYTPPSITADNTVFTAVGAYPNPEERCSNLINSAKKCGVPIRWIDWGMTWHGFNQHKLRNLQKQFHQWCSEGKRYVMFTDAKDVVYADPLDTIIQKANAIYEPGTLLFNADFDNHFYPYKDEHFKKAVLTRGLLLNSGLIFGDIDTFDKVITYALDIIDGIKKGIPRTGLATYIYADPTARHMLEDDQLTYQLCTVYYPQYFRVDKDRYLFAWVRKLTEDILLDDLRRESVKSGCVGQAGIIHSSSTISLAGQHVWDAWVRNNKLV